MTFVQAIVKKGFVMRKLKLSTTSSIQKNGASDVAILEANIDYNYP